MAPTLVNIVAFMLYTPVFTSNVSSILNLISYYSINIRRMFGSNVTALQCDCAPVGLRSNGTALQWDYAPIEQRSNWTALQLDCALM